jgi:hypothetical protein
MKPMDLTGLIKGLMVVIGIAMALGRLEALKRWATKEAFGISMHKPIHQRLEKVSSKGSI